MGSPGIIHDRTTDHPPSSPVKDAGMTSQMNVALIRGPLMCLAYFVDMLSMRLYNQALAYVGSTGAGIECLYCIRYLYVSVVAPRPGQYGT